MNKAQTEEAIKVMQAWIEGKTIQYRSYRHTEWVELTSPIWDWDCGEYRIKPEPLVIYVVMDSKDMTVRCASKNREWTGTGKVRKFMEVIED